MLKFGGCKELGPLMWVVGTEDAEICFDFLVGWFGLSISLRMVCGRKSNIIFEDPGKFFSERRSELWSSVRDESIMKSKVFEHMVEKELGNTVHVNSLRTRD